MLRIEVSQQGQPPKIHEFDRRQIQVGRSSECDLVLNAPGISSVHAQIVCNEDGCTIRDQNSTNGTYLHGAPIHGPTRINRDDAVYICSYCLHISVVKREVSSLTKSSPRRSPAPPLLPPQQAHNVQSTIPPRPPAAAAPPILKRGSTTATRPTRTIAPNDEKARSQRDGAQQISVQPDRPGPSARRLEGRSWAIPAAPLHVTPEQRIQAQVFASLAQPFIEENRLPPGDATARAQFYALAQAQLSVNLSQRDAQVEPSAEQIVASLCAIGPLQELFASGFFEKPNQELLATPFSPIRTRDTQMAGPWRRHEWGFIHPWALRFAATRLLGRILDLEQSYYEQRLVNGALLSLITQQDMVGGPLLRLRTATTTGLGWSAYQEQTRLNSNLAQLLRASVSASIPIILCESSRAQLSLWNALLDLGTQTDSVAHVSWDPLASYVDHPFTFCANLDPECQRTLCQRARALRLGGHLAIDHPQAPCIRELSKIKDSATETWWFRCHNSSPTRALSQLQPLLRAKLSTSFDPPIAGLLIEVCPHAEPANAAVVKAVEFFDSPEDGLQLKPLFERNGPNLRYVGQSPRLYPYLARQGVELAPPL